MEAKVCLERIGIERPGAVDAEGLRSLHLGFLQSVPFENLDIHLGREIRCHVDAFYSKIVLRRRGGFCYELNGLFAWLLGELGYEVELFSGRVFHDDGNLGQEFDHMLLGVECDGPWIADVGFGDSFVEPLRPDGREREQAGRLWRVREERAGWLLERAERPGAFEPQYVFTRQPRQLEDFSAMCAWQQNAPESIFRRKWTCSLPTRDGRITLANGRWIVTRRGERQEQLVDDVSELRALLRRWFGIELEHDAPLASLLRG